MPRLVSKLQQELALTARSAQQCMNTVMDWKRQRTKAGHTTGGTDNLTCAALLKIPPPPPHRCCTPA